MSARKAYTLIEMMAAVAVVALCASLIIPGFETMRERAQRTACLSNLRQIGAASMAYHADNGAILPWYTQAGGYWWNALAPYIGAHRRVFRCPADTGFDDPAIDRTISYGWNYKLTGHGDSGVNPNDFVRVAAYPRPGQVPVASDGPGGAMSGQEDCWGYIDERPEHTADPKRHDGKAGVLYLDGHVDILSTSELPNNPRFNDRLLQQQ